jgi:hypothetical protein
MNKIFLKVALTTLLIGSCVVSLSALSPAALAANHTQTEGAPVFSGLAENSGHVYISGNSMVWYEPDAEGNRQIHIADLSTGETKTLTKTATRKEDPVVYGNTVVWLDKLGLSTPSSYWWNVFKYDLTTGERQRINFSLGVMSDPAIYGNDVIWHNSETSEMLHYDLSTGKEKSLGRGWAHVVVEGKVVYKNPDSGLDIMTIATGQVRSLVRLPKDNYVDRFVYNGEALLWKQMNKQMMTKMATLRLDNGTSATKNLTDYETKEFSDAYMTIGKTMGAWIEERGGKAVLVGVNLKTGETFTVLRQPGETVYPFWGDQLLAGKDNKLITRTFVRQNTSSGRGGSSAGFIQAIGTLIGPNGGEVLSADGRVKLNVPSGALDRDIMVSLNVPKEAEVLRTKGMPVAGQLIGQPIEVVTAEPFKVPATLEVQYDSSLLSESRQRKLGLYQYDTASERWGFFSGKQSAGNSALSGPVTSEGTYAVVLNDVVFADMNGHWSEQYVDPLAARGIVEGVAPDRFGPDDTLTRAQFAKLLVGSLGIAANSSSEATFQDVGADHWGYGWIQVAAKAGLVEGDGGKFYPDERLTREQMVAMLVRAAAEQAMAEQLDEQERHSALSAYGDHQGISRWAEPYMALGVKQGLIEGYENSLLPQQSSTRAQAAAVIYRFIIKREKL